MRTEAFILLALMAATPSYASKSCMTMAEARLQFATSHLYWHGPGHCWDATGPLHRTVQRLKPRQDQQTRLSIEPKWRNAMSEMLAGDAPVEASPAPSPGQVVELTGVDWLDRWIDFVPVVSPVMFDGGDAQPAAEPVTARGADHGVTWSGLILMFPGLFAALALIGLLLSETSTRRENRA
jgi:hypothetical protein